MSIRAQNATVRRRSMLKYKAKKIWTSTDFSSRNYSTIKSWPFNIFKFLILHPGNAQRAFVDEICRAPAAAYFVGYVGPSLGGKLAESEGLIFLDI